MKLSAKGKAKLRKFGDTFFWAIETGDPVEDTQLAINEFEFDAEDFQGSVVLTSDEARYALKCVRFLASGCNIEIDKDSQSKMWAYADELMKLIDKAEGK